MDDALEPPEEEAVVDDPSPPSASSGGDQTVLPGGSTADDAPDEPFVRYQNPFYRVMTMAGGGLVLILGLTGAIMSRTLDPQPPIQWMWLDLGVTAVLLTWYLLGMRCRLDVADEWVEINTKYGTRRLARSEVESVEPDLSLWGSLQPAGRPLLLHLTNGKRVKAPACLPSDRLGQADAVEELQDTFGRPESVRQAELDASMERRLASMPLEADPEVADSMRRRLESMTPEGDATHGMPPDDAATDDRPPKNDTAADDAASTSQGDQS